MMELDVLSLDRDIRHAAAQERAWLRSLRIDAISAGAEAWFEPVRHVTTRAAFESASSLPEGDPFREPLRRWIYRLALNRIGQPALVQTASTRQARQANLKAPEPGAYSARDLIHRALGEVDARRRALWIDALSAAAVPVAAAERQAHEAMLEIGLRLGVGDPAALWSFDADELREAASDVLRATEELARVSLGGAENWAALLGTLVARDVA